jgi:phosphoserine phosphatase
MTDVVIQGNRLPEAVHDWVGLTQPLSVETVSPTVIRLVGAQSATGIPALAESHGLDWAVLTPPRRWEDFRLLAMDMDSTLITIECIDQLADLAGVGAEVAAITESAMRGELDFSQSLRRRVRLLAGLPETALNEVYQERLRLSPGAEDLLGAARAHGLKTLLVSGGFTYFTSRLQSRLGLDFTLANTLEAHDGRLTGELTGGIVDARAKANQVAEVCAGLGTSTGAAIVVGDGANDLEMMAGAGLSVAYRAKPKVQAKAHAALNQTGLDGVIHLLKKPAKAGAGVMFPKWITVGREGYPAPARRRATSIPEMVCEE